MQWEYCKVHGGGEKWVLWHLGRRVGAVVRLPGTMCRVFFNSGPWDDYTTVLDATRRLRKLALSRFPEATVDMPPPNCEYTLGA